MIDVAEFASNLCQREDGIWLARSQREISYPVSGNESCFAVEDGSFWFAHRNRVISELVRRYSPDAAFFDIGGGNGCVSMALQTAGFESVLVEPGPSGAMNAKRRGLNTVIQSTLQDAGFKSASIPAAGVFDVVEHIENDTEFAGQLCDYLVPGGYLFVTVPAFESLWASDDVHAGHFRRYTVKSLSQLLTHCGFELAYSGYLFSFLVPSILLCRTIPSRLGFRKSVSGAVTRREHAGGGGFIRWIIQSLLNAEFRKVESGKSIQIGSSCIAVAKKRP